jgi:hypothetical protein
LIGAVAPHRHVSAASNCREPEHLSGCPPEQGSFCRN